MLILETPTDNTVCGFVFRRRRFVIEDFVSRCISRSKSLVNVPACYQRSMPHDLLLIENFNDRLYL